MFVIMKVEKMRRPALRAAVSPISRNAFSRTGPLFKWHCGSCLHAGVSACSLCSDTHIPESVRVARLFVIRVMDVLYAASPW